MSKRDEAYRRLYKTQIQQMLTLHRALYGEE